MWSVEAFLWRGCTRLGTKCCYQNSLKVYTVLIISCNSENWLFVAADKSRMSTREGKKFSHILSAVIWDHSGGKRYCKEGCISNLFLVQSYQFQDLNNNSPHCLPYIFWNLRIENLVLNQEISLNIFFFVHFSSHFFRLDWLYNTGLPQLAFLLFIFFS